VVGDWSRKVLETMVEAERSSPAGISEICKYIDAEVSKLRPTKEQLQQKVELAVQSSPSGLLRACAVEMVGSVSWGGEVPQSDLDLMLCSADNSNDRNTAIFLLQELCSSLQEQSQKNGFEWARLEFLDSARIPILCVEDSEGCRCDIGVDQLQALHHRDFLREAVASQPHLRDLVRLVKFWVRQQGLPLASDGGLPSLAWVFAALCLADGQPAGTSLEVLLMHFFSEMRQLLTHRLQVLPCNAQNYRTFWSEFDKPNPWHKEWIQNFQVVDPSRRDGQQSFPDITPPRLPTALVSLYVGAVRIAWQSIRDGQWEKVWTPVSEEAAVSLMTALAYPRSQGAPLHVVLKNGMVVAGIVEEQGCQGDLSAKDLQRRDHYSMMHLQPCTVDPQGVVCPLRERKITFHPSQWLCALPASELQLVKGDAISRVAEIADMLGIAQTSQGLHGIVAALKYQHVQFPIQMAMPTAACYYNVVWFCPFGVDQGGYQGQSRHLSESGFPSVKQRTPLQKPSDKTIGDLESSLESEESTRASDNESHSSTRSLQIPRKSQPGNGKRNSTNGSICVVDGEETAPRSNKPNKKNQKPTSSR